MLLDYSVIFEEKSLPIQEYLKGIRKEELKLITSHFLGLDIHTTPLNNWREFIKMWFRHENHGFAKKIEQRCEFLESKYTSIGFLCPPALLKFFEFSKFFKEDFAEVDEGNSEKNLFIVYLLFLSAVTDKESISGNYIETLPEALKLSALILNQQFAYGEYYNFQLSDVLITQIIKACYLFLFLEVDKTANYLLVDFCNFYGLRYWQEFFQFILPLIQAHALHPHKGGWTHLNVPRDENFSRNCFFLESLSKEIDIESDFKSLRSNPLYKVDDGVYGIIYPLFVVEKLFKGSYFKLKDLNERSQINNFSVKKIANWKQFYTQNFSESTLLYKILEYIFGNRPYIKFSGDSLKEIDLTGPPDYYIRSGNDVYIFESKDIYINGILRQSFDFESLEKALKDKLYFTTEIKENGRMKTKPKAVLQLAKNVRKILTQENIYDTAYKSSSIRIYPILILHDASFECPGLNFLINYWFDIEIKKLNDEGIATTRVRKITIINIDTLILYADFLKIKKQALSTLIDGYITHGILKLLKKPMTKEEVQEIVSTTYDPFSIFIDQSTNVGHRHVKNALADNMMKTILRH